MAEVVLRYCRGVDRLDLPAVRACYHDDAVDHHTGFDGNPDDYVAWLDVVLRRFAGTMHFVGNCLVEVDGDRARAETYGNAHHWGDPVDDPTRNFVSGFRYVDRFERRDGVWRVAERWAVREWTRSIPAETVRPKEGGRRPDPRAATGTTRSTVRLLGRQTTQRESRAEQEENAPMNREDMEYRTMGRSGLPVSTIGLGCNNFGMLLDQADSAAVVQAALDAGITLFDTADSYGNSHSEEYLGAALAGHRDDVVIATKFSTRLRPGPYGRGRPRSTSSRPCEASLRRLGTDYIDLYYQHNLDPATPVKETVDTLDDLIRAGKVRYAGCSNVKGWTLARAQHVAAERGRQRFVACQNEWSLVNRAIEAEVVPACRAYEVGMGPVLSAGVRTVDRQVREGGAVSRGLRLATASFFAGMATDEVFETVGRLQAVADDTGHSLVELALGWLLYQEGVASVLVGATKPEQVATNAATAGVSLTPDVLAAVTEAAGG